MKNRFKSLPNFRREHFAPISLCALFLSLLLCFGYIFFLHRKLDTASKRIGNLEYLLSDLSVLREQTMARAHYVNYEIEELKGTVYGSILVPAVENPWYLGMTTSEITAVLKKNRRIHDYRHNSNLQDYMDNIYDSERESPRF